MAEYSEEEDNYPMDYFTPEEMNEFYKATVTINRNEDYNCNEASISNKTEQKKDEDKKASGNTNDPCIVPLESVTFSIAPTPDHTSKKSTKRHLSLEQRFRQHKRLKQNRRHHKTLKNLFVDGDITQRDLEDYYKYYDTYNTYLEQGETIQNEDKHIIQEHLEWQGWADSSESEEEDDITYIDGRKHIRFKNTWNARPFTMFCELEEERKPFTEEQLFIWWAWKLNQWRLRDLEDDAPPGSDKYTEAEIVEYEEYAEQEQLSQYEDYQDNMYEDVISFWLNNTSSNSGSTCSDPGNDEQIQFEQLDPIAEIQFNEEVEYRTCERTVSTMALTEAERLQFQEYEEIDGISDEDLIKFIQQNGV